MGESFTPFPYVDEQLEAIWKALTPGRLDRYMRAAKGDARQALRLYLYDARLARAFLFPLSMAEVVLRNGISEQLAVAHGPNWYELNSRSIGMAASSAANLKEVVGRLRSEKGWVLHQDRQGQIVTALPFEFWCGLLRSSANELWENTLRFAFPNLDRGQGRETVASLASKLSRFRNRVVHHEPIFEGWDLQRLQSDAIELIRMVCEDTAFWVRHHSTVMHAIRTKPERGEVFEPLIARCTEEFELVDGSWTIKQVVRAVRSQARVIAIGGQRMPHRCLWVADVLKLVLKLSESDPTGLFSRPVWDATASLPRSQFVIVPGSAPYASAKEMARDRGAEVIFSTSGDRITGVHVLRADSDRR